MLVTIGFLLLLLLCSSYAGWKAVRRRRQALSGEQLPLPPGRLGLPWLGESLSLLAAMKEGDHDRFLRERTVRYGNRVFKTGIFNEKVVVLQGASANRFIAVCEQKGLLRNSWPPSMLAIVGKGAPIAMHGSEHRRLRHILLACLSPAALQKLVHRTHTLTLHHFATLWPQRRRDLPLVPLLNRHNFRLACSLIANITDERLLSRLHANFRTWLAGMLDLPIDLPGTNYRRSRVAGDNLRHEVGNIINQRKLAQQSCSAENSGDSVDSDQWGPQEDLLATLLNTRDENSQFLSQQEMQDVLVFLLFAGQDTVNAALTFALKFLEQNPDCLEKVVQEQEHIARQKKSANELLSWADVQSMRYTWRVIQETLRLRPPVTASLKEATEDLEFEGYRIPKGWKVYLSYGRTHADDDYFPNASAFDPSRFDHGTRLAFSYVPFGVGPHTCPGNEFARMAMCVYLHVLVRHFKWASLHPQERVVILTFPTPVHGYPATVIPTTPIS